MRADLAIFSKNISKKIFAEKLFATCARDSHAPVGPRGHPLHAALQQKPAG